MCGIVGVVSQDSISIVDRRAINGMLDCVAHRGPDGRGFRTDHNAAFGHTRLAIIDPERGAQPISNEDDTTWIVSNGEIYNYRELRAQLEAKGHRFKTHSDAETILHLYEDVGPACTEQLRGMFAFAIWDSVRRTLLLARDHMGIKPLYYTIRSDTIIFASTLTALLAHPAVTREVDLESLHNYLTYHYIPSPGTILRGVSKLRPAERLVFKNGVARVDTYWDLSFRSDEHTSEDTWSECVRAGIADAVRANTVSDVPVGAFLSGGLDSSTVVATMVRIADKKVRSNTVGFDDPRYDERSEARKFALRMGCDHYEQVIRPDAKDVLQILPQHFDEPFGDPSAIPTYYASRMARQQVKVVLSGDGGDELFAGYRRYHRAMAVRTPRNWIAEPYARQTLRACAWPFGRRLRAAARNLTVDEDYAHYLDVAWFDPRDTSLLLNHETRRALIGHNPMDVLARHFARCDSRDPLARSQYVDIKTWLADGVLCKVDRASMANGLEVRVPLLDVPFVERMAALPPELKIRRTASGVISKHILRTAMRPLLGSECVSRSKSPFEVPLDAWFAGPLQPLVTDLLLSSDSHIAQWIDTSAIERIASQLKRGRRGLGPRLWALLMLELWSRKHLAADPPRQAAYVAEETAEISLASSEGLATQVSPPHP